MRRDPVLVALAEQHEELDRLISPLSESGWATPSRCDGWSVSDVVLHLVQTDAMAVASVEGRFAETVAAMSEGLPPAADIDEGAALMVERGRERRESGEQVAARWREGASRLRDRLAETDAGTRLTWVAGTLSARTLATTRLAECWIHTGDIAAGLGVAHEPTDRLWQIARLAWRTLPYAFTRAGAELSGPVAFELKAPSGETWRFADDSATPPAAAMAATTTIRGSAHDLCMVAARRVAPEETSLTGDGPDAAAVLSLVRTWA